MNDLVKEFYVFGNIFIFSSPILILIILSCIYSLLFQYPALLRFENAIGRYTIYWKVLKEHNFGVFKVFSHPQKFFSVCFDTISMDSCSINSSSLMNIETTIFLVKGF